MTGRAEAGVARCADAGVAARPDEDGLIARFFAPLATDPGSVGLRDDAAALVPPPGADLVLTCDALVSGVHFLPDDPPADIARKALRVNLSDLAAKGARPLGYLLALALPEDWTAAWLGAFAAGLGADQSLYGVPLLGGDTTRAAGPLVLSVTAVGAVPTGRTVRRSGARPGDVVAVTGSIGDAALGLQLRLHPALADTLDAAASDHLVGRYRLPQPRLDQAAAVLERAHAAMDVSDGLVGDLAKLCRASGVGAALAAEDVPLSSAAQALVAAHPALLETALTGGDDYEILAAMPGSALPPGWAAIGRIVAGDGVRVTQGGRELPLGRTRFSHF